MRKSIWFGMIIAVLAIGLIVGTVSYPTASAQSHSVPKWVKGVAGFWSEDKISEDEFVGALEFLIENGAITVPGMVATAFAAEDKKGQPFEELWAEIHELQEHQHDNGIISFWDALKDMQDQIDILRVGTGIEGDLVPYWDFNNVILQFDQKNEEQDKRINHNAIEIDELRQTIATLNQQVHDLQE